MTTLSTENEVPAPEANSEPVQDYSFSKDEHLLKGHEFRFMRENGKGIRGKFLVMSVAKAPDSKRRIGIIASKKLHNRAYKRNRAKRLIRESFRLLKSDCQDGTWYIFIARKFILQKDMPAVKKEMQELIQKAGLFKSVD